MTTPTEPGHGVAMAGEHLDCRLGGRPILHDVSMTAATGGMTALLGPNGSGKTTLLHLLAGLTRPAAGRVLIDGTPLADLPARRRARTIALVEQHATTALDLTVRQVIELGRIPHRGRWPVRRGEGADALARATHIAAVAPLLDRPWGALSGGEQQRVHLARAVAQEPHILLLDEPTNHLDLGHQIDFLQRVRALGMTTIAALHDLELAAAFCDTAVMLGDGRVVAAGPIRDVITPHLIDQWYRVDADIITHPHRPRPHLVWNGVTRTEEP